MNKVPATILYIDGFAGVSVGLLLLFFSGIAAELYGLGISVIHFLMIANLLYGLYATYVAIFKYNKIINIVALSFANCLWGIVCILLLCLYYETASLLGVLFIGCEAIFVFFLSFFEWKFRLNLVSI
jgi:hypothetical protein